MTTCSWTDECIHTATHRVGSHMLDPGQARKDEVCDDHLRAARDAGYVNLGLIRPDELPETVSVDVALNEKPLSAHCVRCPAAWTAVDSADPIEVWARDHRCVPP